MDHENPICVFLIGKRMSGISHEVLGTFHSIDSDMNSNKFAVFKPNGISMFLLNENFGVNTIIANKDGTKNLPNVSYELHFLFPPQYRCYTFCSQSQSRCYIFGSYSLLQCRY